MAAEKGRDLKDVHGLCRESSFIGRMDVRGDRNAVPGADVGEDAEGPFVADAREAVEARAIRLAVGALENQGQIELGAHLDEAVSNFVRHLFAFDGARASDDLERAAGGPVGMGHESVACGFCANFAKFG